MSWVSEFPARINWFITQICEHLRARDILLDRDILRRKSIEEIQTQLIAVIRSLLAIEVCNYIVDFDLFTSDDSIGSDSIPIEYNELDVIRRECIIGCQCILQREKQEEELGYYLIRDIIPIILDYSFCHIQHFAIGNPVAVQETERWYVGTVEHIVVVNNFAFLWMLAETFGRSDGDWIPANSIQLKCFYDSRQNRIEKAKFIATKPDKSNCTVDCFDSNVGEWFKIDWFDDGNHTVFAESGTFTA